jgi:secondary thiamine-phosphate synthase enzyme
MQTEFQIASTGSGLYEFTPKVSNFVGQQNVTSGVLTLFIRHTSCSLLIQENADPDVQTDLQAYFSRLVPRSDTASMRYLRHTSEGPDDMPAHIKAAMMPNSLTIPIFSGSLVLGTWQGIYLFEHRDRPHTRSIFAHISS